MPLGIGSPDPPKESSLIEKRTDFLNAATGFANAKVQMDITELLALGDQDLPPRGQKRLLLIAHTKEKALPQTSSKP